MEAAAIAPGSPAVLTLSDTLEQLDGTVLSVSSMDEALTGGRLVRYVTIQVANPGGLTADMTATAAVGDFGIQRRRNFFRDSGYRAGCRPFLQCGR